MFSAKNIVLLTEINGFFDASLLHNYMDVIFALIVESIAARRLVNSCLFSGSAWIAAEAVA
ncbi:hypothetical protein B1157_14715 [Enterococcus faecium]|nr:hypothetical protein B1157_14715 [Enterococcus faecium]